LQALQQDMAAVKNMHMEMTQDLGNILRAMEDLPPVAIHALQNEDRIRQHMDDQAAILDVVLAACADLPTHSSIVDDDNNIEQKALAAVKLEAVQNALLKAFGHSIAAEDRASASGDIDLF
jgi:hypothetical protein